MKLSIIIPAYNEADRIVRTIESSFDYLARQAYESEIIVVSDGSTDNTKSVVENRCQSGRPVTLSVVEYHPNRGKGYAVKTGMLEGRGDIIMFMDADYSVPVDALETGVKMLSFGYDVAIASRTLSGSVIHHHQNVYRELSARLYTWIQNRYLGIRYGDTQCGFKLFTRQAAHALFQRQKLSSVIFDPEILWLAKKEGFSVAEFPVEWTHIEDSRIQYDSLGKSLFVFRELFRIRTLHKSGHLPEGARISSASGGSHRRPPLKP